MLAKVYSCAVVGLDGVLVEVEVDVGTGNRGTVVVGLPDAAVQESKERVRSAIRNSGGKFPHGRVTVNLAPADLKKAGPTYDLPIALGILVASKQVPAGAATDELADALVVGELSLDGVLRHTPGIIPMLSLAASKGMRHAYVPHEDAAAAALVDGVAVVPVRTLADLVNHLTGEAPIAPYANGAAPPEAAPFTGTDSAEVRGQEHVKHGLEVAAAGSHNVRMSGPPGSGKTLLARALPSILPAMTTAEALEVTKVYRYRDNHPLQSTDVHFASNGPNSPGAASVVTGCRPSLWLSAWLSNRPAKESVSRPLVPDAFAHAWGASRVDSEPESPD